MFPNPRAGFIHQAFASCAQDAGGRGTDLGNALPQPAYLGAESFQFFVRRYARRHPIMISYARKSKIDKGSDIVANKVAGWCELEGFSLGRNVRRSWLRCRGSLFRAFFQVYRRVSPGARYRPASSQRLLELCPYVPPGLLGDGAVESPVPSRHEQP